MDAYAFYALARLQDAVLILTLIIALSSCGTINKTSSIVAVDSTPRGVKVYDEEDHFLGQTPFFLKMRPEYNHRYQGVYGGQRFPIEHSCKINWSKSVVPDLIPSLFKNGYYLSVPLLLTDWISGGIYRCDRDLNFNISFENINAGKVDFSNKIVILPPMHIDPNVSDDIVHKWIKKYYAPLSQHFKQKWQIVDYATTKKKFYPFSITNFSENSPTFLKREHLKDVAYQTGATHFLYFDRSKMQDHVVATLYDVFSMKIVHEAELSKTFILRTRKEEKFQEFFLKGISILPNSVDFSIPVSTKATLADNFIYYQKSVSKHPQALPSIVTAFGLSSVEHPQFYHPWDYTFSLGPGIAGKSWKAEMGDVYGRSYNILAESYSLAMYLKLTLFSPWGQMGIGYGFHGGMLSLKEEKGQSSRQFEWGPAISLNFSWFLSQRYYAFVEMKRIGYAIRPELSTYPITSWSSSVAGIGYYFPEMRISVRNGLD